MSVLKVRITMRKTQEELLAVGCSKQHVHAQTYTHVARARASTHTHRKQESLLSSL